MSHKDEFCPCCDSHLVKQNGKEECSSYSCLYPLKKEVDLDELNK